MKIHLFLRFLLAEPFSYWLGIWSTLCSYNMMICLLLPFNEEELCLATGTIQSSEIERWFNGLTLMNAEICFPMKADLNCSSGLMKNAWHIQSCRKQYWFVAITIYLITKTEHSPLFSCSKTPFDSVSMVLLCTITCRLFSLLAYIDDTFIIFIVGWQQQIRREDLSSHILRYINK